MSPCTLDALAAHLDAHLHIADTPDYPPALNGVQISHRGPVHRVAAAVDLSLVTIDGAIGAGANLLVVHHGMFWSGLRPLVGPSYERVHRLIAHDIAVYSAHLPLDAHETHGNSRLLAHELGLEPLAGFARHESIHCGVRGETDMRTEDLAESLRAFSRTHGSQVVATAFDAARRTRRWAICSGSGASRDTLDEAAAAGIDTLIVGEGPHWSAVDARDAGLVILYGGHYATETLGVCSLAAHIERTFGIPWSFIAAPTGL